LHWVTESEVGNLGFYVLRALAEDGAYTRITSERISGAGTSPTWHEYTFTDGGVTPGGTYWYKLEEIALDGTTTVHGPISVTLEVQVLPTEFGLSQNFPNPFNPQTVIRYQLPEASEVRLTVYDLLGQQVEVLVDGFEEAGVRSVVWEAEEVASGIYLVRMEAGDFVEARKLVVVR